MTLDELKEENAQIEAEQQQDTAPVVDEVEESAAEVETEELEQVAEPDQEETEETEVESWMKTDAEEEKKFTDGDVANARRKLKAKLEAKHESELAQRDKELEELRAAQSTQGVAPKKPTREQFDFDDDKYDEALIEWLDNKSAVSARSREQEARIKEQARRAAEDVEARVNSHYERAEKLLKESNIEPDLYRAADLAVREMIDRVLPTQGESITDNLIARLGEGSEKAIFFLGRNQQAQSSFEKKLRDDPTGLEAAMYMGELKSRFNAPKTRVSNAPKPAKGINGDSSTTTSKLKRDYEKATDVQTRFNIKREAKAKGVDVKSW